MIRIILNVISFVGLVLTIVPAFLVFFQRMELQQNKNLMFIGTIMWFVTAPFWMKHKKESAVE
jgi:hypothetical protein